jgi:hypothetical protein
MAMMTVLSDAESGPGSRPHSALGHHEKTIAAHTDRTDPEKVSLHEGHYTDDSPEFKQAERKLLLKMGMPKRSSVSQRDSTDHLQTCAYFLSPCFCTCLHTSTVVTCVLRAAESTRSR